VVIVCAVTTWCDREPQDAGQRADRGVGFADHAFLFSSSTFISHSPNACFARLLTGPGLNAAACEPVKEEMLVSDADSPPQTRCGRLHGLIWASKQTAHAPNQRWANRRHRRNRRRRTRRSGRPQRRPRPAARPRPPSDGGPGSKSRPPSTGCSHVSHRPRFSPVCEPPTVHCPVTRRPNRGPPGRPGPGCANWQPVRSRACSRCSPAHPPTSARVVKLPAPSSARPRAEPRRA
jgi:hypothetical protein